MGKRMGMVAALLALLAVLVAAQDYARQKLFFYDAAGNLEYVCEAASEGHGTTTWALADKTLTGIVDAGDVATVTTAAAHGLTAGATITIAGATVDADLNGAYVVATTPSVTTFTVATAAVTDATYTDATLAVRFMGPRTTGAIWSIERYYWDAEGNLVKTATATSAKAAPGRVARDRKCADRATYEYR